jgi:hypothetical protein
MDNFTSQDALFEALTLDIEYEEPTTPMFTCFGGLPKYWGWWGCPWISESKLRKYKKDVVYKNKDGKRHRLYGPAYISQMYEIEIWYKDGKLHREDGPAFSQRNNFAWFFEGELHNLSGPAVIEGAGPKQYWIHGQKMCAKEYKKQIASRIRRGIINENKIVK